MSVQSLIADLLPASPSSPPMAKAASHVPPAKAANLAKTRVVTEFAPVAKAAKPWLKMAKTPSAPPGEDPVLATFSRPSPDFSQAESRAVTGGLATLAALAGVHGANDTPAAAGLAAFSHASPPLSHGENQATTRDLAALAALAGEGGANSFSQPPPASASRAEIEAWMDAVGETDTVTRNEVLENYGFVDGAHYPDSGRRTCRECINLDADGGCRAARRGEIQNASKHYTWPAGIDAPHRCLGYLPGPDDPDRRPGRERFDWLLKMMKERQA